MSPETSISIGGKRLDPVRGGLLLLVVGLAIAGFGAYDYLGQSDAISDAVAVDATVTGTDIETVSQRRGGPEYRPTVTFEYTHGGEAYTASGLYPVTLAPSYDTRSEARTALEGYEPGETVTAYVDPDAPNEAFLERERSNAPLELSAIGGVIAFVACVSVLKGRRRA